MGEDTPKRTGVGKKAKPSYNKPPVKQKFTGSSESMAGHIFDLGDNQADVFIAETVEQLVIYMGSGSFKHGGILASAIEARTVPVDRYPPPPKVL